MTPPSHEGPKHLYAEFAAKPGAESRVALMVARYAEQVRGEAGCLSFDPFVRRDDDRRWVVFETYLDEAAFQAHMTTEHNRVFNEQISSHIEGGASSVIHLATPFEA